MYFAKYTLKYLRNLEEAALIRRLFTDIDSATSLSSTSGKIPLWAFGFLY